MFKTFTAGLMALTLTFTSATPTQANGLSEDDVGKLLFGLVATAVIANAIKNNRDNDRGRATVQQKPRHEPRADTRRHEPRADTRRHQPRGHGLRRNTHRSSVPAPLPRSCMRIIENRHGTQRIFGKRCLERNYAQADYLPRNCAVRFNTHRGQRRGFDARCLRNNGYSARH